MGIILSVFTNNNKNQKSAPVPTILFQESNLYLTEKNTILKSLEEFGKSDFLKKYGEIVKYCETEKKGKPESLIRGYTLLKQFLNQAPNLISSLSPEEDFYFELSDIIKLLANVLHYTAKIPEDPMNIALQNLKDIMDEAKDASLNPPKPDFTALYNIIAPKEGSGLINIPKDIEGGKNNISLPKSSTDDSLLVLSTTPPSSPPPIHMLVGGIK